MFVQAAAEGSSATIGFGLLGVLVGSIIAAASSYFVALDNRRATTQIAALYTLQDRALGLRRVLREWGSEAVHTADSTNKLDDAFEEVEMAAARIRCLIVRRRLSAWSEIAQWYWDAKEEGEHVEREPWEALLESIRRDLKHYG